MADINEDITVLSKDVKVENPIDESQELKKLTESQESQESQGSQKSQESQASQEIQESKELQEPQEKKSTTESPEFKEITNESDEVQPEINEEEGSKGSEVSEVNDDEDQVQPVADLEEDISKLSKFKKSTVEKSLSTSPSKPEQGEIDESGSYNNDEADHAEEIEDEQTRKRREFEEKFNALIKKPSKKRKNNDVDLEAMQDEAISHLKNMMKDAAYMDIDCVNNKKPATNKLKLLPQVKDTLLRSNLYDSILDNNMLEAVRIWLEPLPDASLPSFEIQKTLLNELGKLPIKTIHLRESGLGKVMIFYQKSKKVDPALKRVAEKLIGDWTRPVMGRSDNYRAREIPTANFDVEKFRKKTKLQSSVDEEIKNKVVRKSLYQESADRRKRAAAPEARTSVYTIAPQSNLASLQLQNSSVLSMGIGSSLNRDERFKAINKKLTKLSQKRKNVKKDGVSIEGRGLNI